MFSIRLSWGVDPTTYDEPSYFAIYKDGKLWCQIGFNTWQDACDHIALTHPAEAKEMEDIYWSV